jgi:hypothetical protein
VTVEDTFDALRRYLGGGRPLLTGPGSPFVSPLVLGEGCRILWAPAGEPYRKFGLVADRPMLRNYGGDPNFVRLTLGRVVAPEAVLDQFVTDLGPASRMRGRRLRLACWSGEPRAALTLVTADPLLEAFEATARSGEMAVTGHLNILVADSWRLAGPEDGE